MSDPPEAPKDNPQAAPESPRDTDKDKIDTNTIKKALSEIMKNEKADENKETNANEKNAPEEKEKKDASWSDFDSDSSSSTSSSDEKKNLAVQKPNASDGKDTMVTKLDDVQVPRNGEETPKKDDEIQVHRPAPPSSARSARHRRDIPITGEGFKPRPPTSPRNDPRFAHLRSTYSRGYYMTGKEPDPPAPRPEPSATIKRFIEKALADQPMAGLPDETYDEVIMELGAKRKDMAASHRYQDGLKYNKAIKHVSKYQMQEQKAALQKTAKKEYEKKRDMVANEIKEFDEETQRLLTEMKENQRIQREQLLENQKQEREQHRNKWTSQHMTRMYNRASNHLTAMRRQHAFLLVQCRFDEAEDASKRIKEVERSEEDESSRLMQFQYDESVRKLKQKQQDERMFFDNNSAIQAEKLAQNRAKLRQALENKMKKVEEQGDFANDTERVWNAQQLHRKDDLAIGKTMHAGAPSSKMTRKDIRDRDVGLLALPPLKLDREIKAIRRQRRKKRS